MFENVRQRFIEIVFALILSTCSGAPGYYGEPFLAGPGVVSGHHLPPPLLKTYVHPPLYGAHPLVKTPVIAPGSGFIKAPIMPTAYGILGGHYGHISPYLH